MSVKTTKLTFTDHQLESLRLMFEDSDLLSRKFEQLPEFITQCVLVKLYKDKLVKRFAFPERMNKLSLKPEESAALLWAMMQPRAFIGEYHHLTIQKYINQLHQHHA